MVDDMHIVALAAAGLLDEIRPVAHVHSVDPIDGTGLVGEHRRVRIFDRDGADGFTSYAVRISRSAIAAIAMSRL